MAHVLIDCNHQLVTNPVSIDMGHEHDSIDRRRIHFQRPKLLSVTETIQHSHSYFALSSLSGTYMLLIVHR